MTRCQCCHRIIYPFQRVATKSPKEKIHYACWVEWSIDLFDRQIVELEKAINSLIEATFPEREAIATKKSFVHDGWEYKLGGPR